MICAENDFCTLELGKWRIWQRTIISIPKGGAGPVVLRHTKVTTWITYGKCCIEHGMRHVMENCHNILIHFSSGVSEKSGNFAPK